MGVKLLNYHKQMHYHEYICRGKWALFFDLYETIDWVKCEFKDVLNVTVFDIKISLEYTNVILLPSPISSDWLLWLLDFLYRLSGLFVTDRWGNYWFISIYFLFIHLFFFDLWISTVVKFQCFTSMFISFAVVYWFDLSYLLLF